MHAEAPSAVPLVRVPAKVPAGLVRVAKSTAAARGLTVVDAWKYAMRWWVLSNAPSPVVPLADEDED